ncbi:hypothetical protein Pfo_027308, partial [Paulownia fortunei]
SSPSLVPFIKLMTSSGSERSRIHMWFRLARLQPTSLVVALLSLLERMLGMVDLLSPHASGDSILEPCVVGRGSKSHLVAHSLVALNKRPKDSLCDPLIVLALDGSFLLWD